MEMQRDKPDLLAGCRLFAGALQIVFRLFPAISREIPRFEKKRKGLTDQETKHGWTKTHVEMRGCIYKQRRSRVKRQYKNKFIRTKMRPKEMAKIELQRDIFQI